MHEGTYGGMWCFRDFNAPDLTQQRRLVCLVSRPQRQGAKLLPFSLYMYAQCCTAMAGGVRNERHLCPAADSIRQPTTPPLFLYVCNSALKGFEKVSSVKTCISPY